MERETIQKLIESKEQVGISLSNGREYSGKFTWISDVNAGGDYLIYFYDYKENRVTFCLSNLVDIYFKKGGKSK